MTFEKMLGLVKNSYKGMLLMGLLVGAMSFAVLVYTQKSYRGNTDLLVVQNQQGFSDYYALSKSSDYLSGILMESVYSEKFLEEIKNTNMVSSNFLPTDKAERLKEWQKIVQLEKNANVGIITVKVFTNSQKQVAEISNAVVNVLTNKYSLFLGQGQNVEIRVLSGPIVEKNPTFIQILLISLGGFVIGIFLTFMLVCYKSEYSKNKTKFASFGENTFVHNVSPKPMDDLSADSDYWKNRLSGNNLG